MATYQFTALDTHGNEKRGTIEAGTQQEAFAAIQSHGLQPTNVFAANQPRDVFAERAGAAGPRRASSAAGVVGLVLSILALLTALAALGWQFFRPHPLGKGIGGYDFSSPKAALQSQLKIEEDIDVLAQIELQKIRRSKELEEELRTLDVRKEEPWKQDMIIVFFSYQQKGTKHYETRGFEKDAKTGHWLPKYISPFEVEKENAALAKRMRDWQGGGKMD
jgi:hypothetical protein